MHLLLLAPVLLLWGGLITGTSRTNLDSRLPTILRMLAQ